MPSMKTLLENVVTIGWVNQVTKEHKLTQDERIKALERDVDYLEDKVHCLVHGHWFETIGLYGLHQVVEQCQTCGKERKRKLKWYERKAIRTLGLPYRWRE